MHYLKNLITKKTPILNLSKSIFTSTENKKEILGNDGSLSKEEDYLKMMYLINSNWYYFKEETENYAYPFYLIDELMGSYLARKIDLNAVAYFISYVKTEIIGIASKNLREEGFTYYFGDYYSTTYQQHFRKEFNLANITNIDNLKILCNKEENIEIFLQHILKMLALDVFMLQKDRKNPNIQFKIDENKGYIDLGPLYDFANCDSKIDNNIGIFLKNSILTLNDYNINLLIKHYKPFSIYLSNLLELGMTNVWQEICIDYHFNKNCLAYEEIYEYYKIKEESQRRYLSLLLNKK